MRGMAAVRLWIIATVITWSAPTIAGELSLDRRIEAQRAIEQVYWEHRIWPKDNPEPKPPLSAVLPDDALRSRVEDVLRKSAALEALWRRPITGGQLQAEMDRMARSSRDPERLRELFAALDDDPELIAETLVRSTLVDRLAREWYARDERFHGALKRRAAAALSGCGEVGCMRSMGGEYRETRWKRGGDGGRTPDATDDGSVRLGADDWTDHLGRLTAKVGGESGKLAIGRISGLEETAEAFEVTAVLSYADDAITTATVVWPKTDFDRWWGQQRQSIPNRTRGTSFAFTPASITSPGCANDTWISTLRAPYERSLHTAVWTGSEMIVWGGTSGAYLASGGRYNPATDTWQPTSTGANVPTARSNHTAVWTGTVMVIWGGITASGGPTIYLGSGGRYNPTTNTWQETSTGANVPAARSLHTAVWTGTRMIVWGGWNLSTPAVFNDGGRYDPSTDMWTATSLGTNVPGPKANHTAVWTNTEMIVWGSLSNTGGRYNPSTDTWLPTSTGANVPSSRTQNKAVWTGSEMIVWGGSDGSSNFLNTGGRYNPSADTWQPTSTGANVPAARSFHTAVWAGHEMIVWGGSEYNTANTFNSGGRYDPSTDTWQSTSTGTSVPSARSNHSAVWTGSEMIVWGGDGASYENTGGRYAPSIDTWTPTATGINIPSPRTNHTGIWTGSEMVVWGGLGAAALNTGGRFDPATDTWSPTSTGNSVPSPRQSHTAVWTGVEMIVWGGSSASDGGRYNPTTDAWRPTSTLTNVPVARSRHTAIWSGSRMVVWGGGTATTPFYTKTGGRYDPYADTWTPTSIGANVPDARADHTAVWTGSEMIVWGGGSGGGGLLNTGGRYDPSSDTWLTTSTGANVPALRTDHVAVWTGTVMIVWGGDGNGVALNNGGRYNPSSNSWQTTSTGANLPAARYRHTGVWTGAELIVWGGGIFATLYNNGGRYNPVTDAWATMSTPGAPGASRNATAVWTATEMIVWGGDAGSGNRDSGGRYCACPSGVLAYRDADVDGYGDPGRPLPSCLGTVPAGYVANRGDCDDSNASIHPGVPDATCNDIDEDCDGQVDDGVNGGCIATPVFQPSDKDNTIFDVAPDSSNGIGKWMYVGVIKDTRPPQNLYGKRRRGLVHFDLTTRFPPGSIVNVVGVTLRLNSQSGNGPQLGGSNGVSIHEVSQDWGESTTSNSDNTGDPIRSGNHQGGQGVQAGTNDATWTYARYATEIWGTPGGSFDVNPSATTTSTPSGPTVWSASATQNPEMLADVKSWIESPALNHGWLVKATNENQRQFTRRFITKDDESSVPLQPRLEVTYTSGATGACCYTGPSGQKCEKVTGTECTMVLGGDYAGDNTTCEDASPCIVACCDSVGQCTPMTASDCRALGRFPGGETSACGTTYCPMHPRAFLDPLPILPAAVPISGTAGNGATYRLAIQEFNQKLHTQFDSTRVWGYDRRYPGPTIEAFRGRPDTLIWINDLRTPQGNLRTTHILPVDPSLHGAGAATARVVTHLHGGHIPANVDGHPDSTFLPGFARTYVYPNNQGASTLWYHDHALGITRLNVMMGLAGFYLLRDTEELALPLPRGEFEIPLAIQDRSFNPNGSLHYPRTAGTAWHEHFFGDQILVNGKVWPYLNVKAGKYRFRLLNGSNSRTYTLALENGAPFWVIADEQGLLPAPNRRDVVRLTPGERLDVVIDFAPYSGTQFRLLNSAAAPEPGVVADVIKFVVGTLPGHTTSLPATLRPVPRILESEAVATRTLELGMTDGMWTITSTGGLSGHRWNLVSEYPVLGTTEIWSFANNSNEVHPIHLHLVKFQLLDRRNSLGGLVAIDSTERGWKDTVPVGPGETVRLIMRFEDYLGQFAYHCHVLEHEDNEMMRQFKVISPTTVLPEATVGVTRLGHGWPNPSRGHVNIEFSLAAAARTRVEVHDLAGRRVVTLIDARLEAGRHLVVWDGHQPNRATAPPGLYFSQLLVDGRPVASRRLIMLH